MRGVPTSFPTITTMTAPGDSGAQSSSASSTSVENKRKSKKASHLLASLFIKEPSTQALADYRKSQLKSAGLSLTERKSATVTLPGVSTAKLPADVPKVNSKWDGIPSSVKKTKSKK